MGLDNLDFAIRTLNRLDGSVRHGFNYNAHQGGGRNRIGSWGRWSQERPLVDLFNAGKRSKQKTDGGILGVEELERNEGVET